MKSEQPRMALPDRKTLAQWVIEAEGRAELAEQALANAEQHARAALEVGPANRLLTVSEAADALRISRATTYRLFASGELRWVQVGAHRRITADEIERFIATHTRSAP